MNRVKFAPWLRIKFMHLQGKRTLSSLLSFATGGNPGLSSAYPPVCISVAWRLVHARAPHLLLFSFASYQDGVEMCSEGTVSIVGARGVAGWFHGFPFAR